MIRGRPSTDAPPLDLLVEAGRNAQAAALALRELAREYPERADIARTLKDLEHQGDRLTRDIIHRLRTGKPTPALDISDGHALAGALDDIVDLAEQTADWFVLYAIEAPMDHAVFLADVLCRATDEVSAALGALRDASPVESHLAEINRLEDEGDRLYRDAVAALFANGIDPMVVIRWKDIFASLEAAVDACETVAHVIDGISLKRSA